MDYKLEDLIDIQLLQNLQDKLNSVYSFPSAIIDNEGKVLTAVAWQDICTKFHRTNPVCEKECIKSDLYILDHISEANPAVSYQCPHGMTDNATPIIIDGKHLGNFFTGQFFLEEPDLEFFKKQATKYGFNEKAYMAAVEKVPVWSKEKLTLYLDFIKGFIEIITGIGQNSLKEIETRKKIKETEERNNAIIQSTYDWIWEIDEQGKYCHCSDRIGKILGYTIKEIIGKTPFDLMPDEERERLKTIFNNLRETNSPIVELENWNLHKDGHLVCLLTNGTPIIDETGKLIGYRGANVDITERKKTEQILRESENKYRRLIDNSPDIVYIFSTKRGGIFYSPSVTKILGYSIDHFSKNPFLWNESVHPEDVERVKNAIVESSEGLSFAVEYRIKSAFNEWIWLFDRSIEISNLVGEILIEGLATDITERKMVEEERRTSEQRYRDLFNQANEGLLIMTLEGQLSDLNPAFAEMHGYTLEELKNSDIRKLDVLGEKVFNDQTDQISRILAGEVVRFEVEHYHKNGHIFPLSVTTSLININGKQFFLAFHQDITERKRAKDAILASRDYLDKIINSVASPIFVKDINHKFTLANDAFCAFLGKSANQLIGSTGNETFSKDQLEVFIAKDREVFASGLENINEEFVNGADGKIKTTITKKTLYTDTFGDRFLVGVINDITELKKAEEKVRKKDMEFRKLSANVPDLIFQFTRRPDGTYFVPIASEGIRNIFGCTPEDVADDFGPIGRVIYPEDAERVIIDIEYSAEHLTYFTCEFRVQIPGREIQWIYSNSTPERLSDGSVTWYGFNIDITDRKKIELELQKAKERAEESDKLKTALLNNMSHEIRTPMNAIVGFSSLLADATEQEKVTYIDIIQKGSDHLLKLTDDVILLSRLQSEKIPNNVDHCLPKEIVSYVYQIFNTQVIKEGIKLKTAIPLQLQDIVIQADENKIRQVLANLVSNALKYTLQGEIEIGYLVKEETIEFYVKDSGIGIPTTEQVKIFDTFYRGEEVLSKAIRGNGLGLNISKELVELMGGTISVDSTHKQGSRFYFSVPLLISKSSELIDQNTNTSDKSIRDYSILVAEDEMVNFIFLKMLLKGKVKSIDHAMNGKEAVEMAFANHYDLILMDLKMPVMDGLEASVLLKRTFPEIIIIAQSAYTLPEEIERAYSAGCDDFISKPINKEILLEKMNNYGKII